MCLDFTWRNLKAIQTYIFVAFDDVRQGLGPFLSISGLRFFLLIAVDADPAIRHENGKQVARWNVDPSYEMSGYQLPPNSSGGGSHAPHPAAISSNRTQAFTTQPHPSSRHHPNGTIEKGKKLAKKGLQRIWRCSKFHRIIKNVQKGRKMPQNEKKFFLEWSKMAG